MMLAHSFVSHLDEVRLANEQFARRFIAS